MSATWVKDDFWPENYADSSSSLSNDTVVTESVSSPPDNATFPTTLPTTITPSQLLGLPNFLEAACNSILDLIAVRSASDAVLDGENQTSSSSSSFCATATSHVCTALDTALDVVVFPLRGIPVHSARVALFGEHHANTVEPTREETEAFLVFCVALFFAFTACLFTWRFRKYVAILA